MITRIENRQNTNTNFKANFTKRAQNIITSHATEFEAFPLMKTWHEKTLSDPKTSHITVDMESFIGPSCLKATATSADHPDKKPVEICTANLATVLAHITGHKMNKITTEQLPAVKK